MAKQKGNSYEQFVAEIKKKQFQSVYFFEGEEPYFIDALANLIEENALQDFEKEFNQTILYGKDVDSARIINEAKRFPMMADKQLVIIREAQEVKDLDKMIEVKSQKSKSGAQINVFEEYIKNPQPSTILVVCYKYKKLDARRTLSKNVKAHTAYFLSESLKDYQLPSWLETYCKQQKISIEPQANAILCEYLGADLQKVANEISKLLINKKDGQKITSEDVRANIGISKDYNVFELQTALISRDVLKANRIINYFAKNPKENPIVVVIATLFGFFSKILIYHTLTDTSEKNIMSELKLFHTNQLRDISNAAKKFSFDKCVRIIGYLREADATSKGVESNQMDDADLLKELLFKILH